MRTIGMIAGGIVGGCLVLAAMAVLCWAAMGFVDPPQRLPLVHAGFQVCAPVQPPQSDDGDKTENAPAQPPPGSEIA